ncbi:MAG: hypothetical protein GXY03_11015 [Solirubrobacterales bacterium]|nr:hypothetical protein [Solirubrobacterales bacterium]
MGMEAFYVMGSVLAVWALLVSLLGVVRKGFPGGRGGEIAIGAITACLVAIAIGTAIVGSIDNQDEGEDQDHAAVPVLPS